LFGSLDAGMYHTCGLTEGGTAYCWGANSSLLQKFADRNGVGYALGAPTADVCVNPILLIDGSPYRGAEWPCSTMPLVVLGGINFRSISSALWSTCGIAVTGETYCWGWNGLDNLGTGTPDYTTAPTLIAGGLAFDDAVLGATGGCGLMDHSAYCWGGHLFDFGYVGSGNFDSSPTPVAVVGGLSFTSVVRSPANNIYGFTCGISSTGKAYCWGANRRGQLGTEVAGLTTCEFEGEFPCSSVPVPVAGDLDMIFIATGWQFACGVGRNRAVHCWGANESGQLGDGTYTDRFTPVKLADVDRGGGA
jgi:alpha-tubulin suppressor-like RCC1 family protein